MALTRTKYRRVTDLYVEGTAHVLKDGSTIWLQVLNPFELDEARRDAQVARARLVMALKSDHGSDDRTRVTSWFFAEGREVAIERLVEAGVGNKLVEILTELRDDPDWAEKFSIMDRSEDLAALPPEDAERKMLEQINAEYLAQVAQMQASERDFLLRKYQASTDADLVEAYVDTFLERRGSEVAIAEFAVTELWYAARVCDGVRGSDGTFDHGGCDGHRLTAFESKVEVRDLPEALQDELRAALAELTMTARDAKNSARQGSSSASSPLPSEPEASTASIPAATSADAPGTSTSPSGTP